MPNLSLPPTGIRLLKVVSGQKPREIAARILVRAAAQGLGGQRGTKDPASSAADNQASAFNTRSFRGGFIEDLVEDALNRNSLSPADRRLCQELVYGVIRWLATLDFLIGQKTGGRTQKEQLQSLLRLGLYQIFWLDKIPDHAAVHETVEQAKRAGFGPQSGFINAVLRGYLREFETTKRFLSDLKTEQPALGFSHPQWLVERWQSRWGMEATARLMAWNNAPPKMFARVNTLRTEPEKLLARWREENVEYDFVRRDWLDENLMFEFDFPVSD